MTREPQVSVVVPFFNSERYIKGCIESLLNQKILDSYELIFVDNGSTDGSAAIVASYPEVTLLDQATPGAYAARNTGIARATAPLIALTDADCHVDPGWISSIQQAMQSPDTGVVLGQCRYPDHASWALRILGAYENAKTEYVIARCPPNRHFAHANNMAVRASVFAEVGPFREWRRAADSELVHRLASRRPDLRLVYCHAMQVTHQEFVTARRRLGRLSLYTRTNARIETFEELDVMTRLRIAGRMLGRIVTG